MKKDTSLKRRRDRDLFEAYQEAIRTHTFASQKEAVEYTRLSEAPRFYISARECVRGLWRICRGHRVSRNRLGFKRMIEIYRRYLEYVASNGYEKSKFHICEMITGTTAPEFYIEYEYAYKIIIREIARHNDEIASRLR